MWIFAAAITLLRAILVLFRVFPDVTSKDIATPIEIHQMISATAEGPIFYFYLVRPKLNLMREHPDLISS
jgi:hypothetical protein